MVPVLAVLPVAVLSWSAILHRWRWAVVMLVVITPFTGPIAFSFHPSRIPLLYRDLLIIAPLYLAYLLDGCPHWRDLPRPLLAAAGALATIVLLEMLNPAINPPLAALIGAKVWLAYLPLAAIGAAWLERRRDLVLLLRLFAVLALVPCLVGIAMWGASALFGYYRTMTAVFGSAADEATQDFAWFWLGAFLYRVPSTFQFPSQYFGFTLFAIVPVYMLLRFEENALWRQMARACLGLILLAGFLSGSRAAYIFIPLLLVLIFVVSGRLDSLVKWVLLAGGLMIVSLWVTGIEPGALFWQLAELVLNYGTHYAWGGLVTAFARGGWLGLGTGMNTGAARHATPNYMPDHIENWYAKALVELGALGLVVVVILVLGVIAYGYRTVRATRDPAARDGGGAIVAFVITMALNSLKGWQVDLEPINYFYWLFVGILFRLPQLEVAAAAKEIDLSVSMRRALAGFSRSGGSGST
jgi:O-antigen ligase